VFFYFFRITFYCMTEKSKLFSVFSFFFGSFFSFLGGFSGLLCFCFFLFFLPSACPTRLSQPTMLTFVHNEEKLRNMKTCSLNEHVYYVGWIHGAVHLTISHSNPFMEEIFNSTFQLEFMLAKSVPDSTFFIIFTNTEKISLKLIHFFL